QFRKPCDIAFRIMITRWRLNPADVVYVGDNLVKDFQAPQQLGMKSIWFKNSDGLYSSGDRGGIEKITKIMELI
ncbi:MAG: HAD family hydrolase, partial [Gracilibacteraceae bacterium]|nr:HAD family hydrolase [Gracilibacteraceae bacterium]